MTNLNLTSKNSGIAELENVQIVEHEITELKLNTLSGEVISLTDEVLFNPSSYRDYEPDPQPAWYIH